MKTIFLRMFILALTFIICEGCWDGVPNKYIPATNFNGSWFFVKADSANADEIEKSLLKGVSVKGMQIVRLPHTANIEPLVVNNQWQGICFYMKKFIVNKAVKDKMLYLYFEGAMNVAEVWVNGKKTVTHEGGYLPFVAPFEPLDGENCVVVKLDNTDNPVTGPKPLKTLDFNTYGGIYRNVWFCAKDSLSITESAIKSEHSGGVFIKTSDIGENSGKVTVTVNIQNAYAEDKETELVCRVLDHNRKSLGKAVVSKILKGSSREDLSCEQTLTGITLWDTDNPWLYTLRAEVHSDGKILDVKETEFGFRKIEITPEGIKLNGKKRFLRGVNRHQEYPYVGYAISDEAQRRDAYKIKNAGFDYVRASHYPQSEAFLQACDRYGILVLDPILGWQYFGDEAFEKHELEDCRYLIRRDRNHPSVLAWELSINETKMTESFMKRANEIAREEFPTEYCYTAGWEKGKYDIFIQARQHRKKGDIISQPLIVSEYGDWEYYAQNAGFNQDSWQNLKPEERTSRQPIESGEKRLLQQAVNITEAHNDNLSTTAFADGYWVMFDYNRGYANDLEYSGIMSINRMPKFSYYFFRSQRDIDDSELRAFAEPMCFIASYWRPGESKGVTVYSNCEEVELFVDGVSYGRHKPEKNSITQNLPHPPFYFDVNCEKEGTLKAVAYDGSGAPVTECVVKSPLSPVRLKLVLDESGSLIAPNDVILVHCYILDKNGTVVSTADSEVEFSVSGTADMISPKTIKAEAGVATALIRVGKNSNDFTVSAKCGSMYTVADR
jgi:beta-galactosidase